jgi:hypothetical protein
MRQAQRRFVIVVMLLATLVPLNGATAKPQTNSLTLPIVASNTAAGATFSGTLTVTRFVARGGDVFAEGIVSGTVKDASGAPLGPLQVRGVVVPVHGNWTVGKKAMGPVRIVPASLTTDALGGRVILAQAATCDVLHLSFGPIDLDLQGVIFSVPAITVDISGDQAGALGALVCAVLGLVGNVANLVNLLNNLLGALTGAVGGVV